MRARDIGLFTASGRTGPLNAIVDVPGVSVGHVTRIAGEGPLVVGEGPIRTGVTVVVPRSEPLALDPLFAGIGRLNGNGEMTGSHWIEESGLLTSPIALTNTHSVGVVRDALVQIERSHRLGSDWWSLPVVAETWDGLLNDINGAHVRAADVWAALDGASAGPVPEGNAGSGTGMICHGFKGGIGTSSRVVGGVEDGAGGGTVDTGEGRAEDGGGSGGGSGASYTVGVLVQANHGSRRRLVIDGSPVGRHLDESVVPLPGGDLSEGMGSIISVVATDAPLLPHQCRSLAARTALGIGRVGGVGEHWSGDLSIAFATGHSDLGNGRLGNPGRSASPGRSGPGLEGNRPGAASGPPIIADAGTLVALYEATVDATEEAIVNALFAAETMTGRDGITAHELPVERVRELVSTRGPAS